MNHHFLASAAATPEDVAAVAPASTEADLDELLHAAAEARLAPGLPPSDATVETDAAIIEAQEQRFAERQAARRGLRISPQADELHRLIDRLDREDLALVLETVRRLAR